MDARRRRLMRPLLLLAAAAALTGCGATAPVVKTETVRVVCPSVAPPGSAWTAPGRPEDLRAYPPLLEEVIAAYEGDRALWAAYRGTWAACR